MSVHTHIYSEDGKSASPVSLWWTTVLQIWMLMSICLTMHTYKECTTLNTISRECRMYHCGEETVEGIESVDWQEHKYQMSINWKLFTCPVEPCLLWDHGWSSRCWQHVWGLQDTVTVDVKIHASGLGVYLRWWLWSHFDLSLLPSQISKQSEIQHASFMLLKHSGWFKCLSYLAA